jgi:pre-rRNA-processing protein TSR4
MASSTRQGWSEEEDDVTRTETSVFLGIPDGPVESASDLKDAAVSRIGGLPVRFIMYLHFVEYIRSPVPGFALPRSPV